MEKIKLHTILTGEVCAFPNIEGEADGMNQRPLRETLIGATHPLSLLVFLPTTPHPPIGVSSFWFFIAWSQKRLYGAWWRDTDSNGDQTWAR